MVKIKWTKHALEELDDIANYISIDSPKAHIKYLKYSPDQQYYWNFSSGFYS